MDIDQSIMLYLDYNDRKHLIVIGTNKNRDNSIEIWTSKDVLFFLYV